MFDNFEPIDTATTDPQSQIVHGATLGQFISLPNTGAGLIDGERVTILSPFGNCHGPIRGTGVCERTV